MEKVPSSLYELNENIIECEQFQNYVLNDIEVHSFQNNIDQSPFNSSFQDLHDYYSCIPYDVISFQINLNGFENREAFYYIPSKIHFSLYLDVFSNHILENMIQNVFIETPNWSYFDLVQSSWDNVLHGLSQEPHEELSRTINIKKNSYEQNHNFTSSILSSKEMDKDESSKFTVMGISFEIFHTNDLISSHSDRSSSLHHNPIQLMKSDFYVNNFLGSNISKEQIQNDILDQIMEGEGIDPLQHITPCSIPRGNTLKVDICECLNSSKGIPSYHSLIEKYLMY